jgi:NodT family efflux transporter outer membrane factor (OMF) lipoprotein
MTARAKLLSGAVLLIGLGGCSLAPVYHEPSVGMTADAWKDSPWQPAQPAENLPRGGWWRIYRDPVLDALELRIEQANPGLAAAVARYDQASAYLGQLHAGLYPSIDAGAGLTQNRQSDDRPLRGSNQPNVYAANTVGVGTNYELDLWGRVRNQVAAGRAAAQASAADVESVRLSLQAQLADDYVRLRGIDAQAKLLNDTVDAYARALDLTQHRHSGGIASGLDVARADTQLRAVKAEAADVAAQRAIYEHAIASLVGEPAMNFSLAPGGGDLTVPVIPTGIPSTLLQRRPDIAAAERRAAAANAAIGVARAAFYPSFSLGLGYGFQNTGEAALLTAPYSFWSIGPGMLLNLFDGGLRDAKLAQARAVLDEAGADYRAVALAAFQQVEDDMALLKYDHTAEQEQDEAVKSATVTLNLALNRYREGAVNYLEVVTAQAAALAAQSGALDLHTRQLRTSVDLVRAVGGGWSREMLEPVAIASNK